MRRGWSVRANKCICYFYHSRIPVIWYVPVGRYSSYCVTG
ncbi:unnamed protein product [Brugia timori]|uniref:Uncharacterized protein n=1 Tax=Brugia timori TaxID=42155 RepID=A0A0R3Q5Y7_9BILA|nr:unnamed protein product [Brugia timori]